MKNPGIRIVTGCALPLFLIFLFPLIGIRSSIALFIFAVIMFGCYWFLTSLPEDRNDYFKDKKYGCH